jgi:hypothetical protein
VKAARILAPADAAGVVDQDAAALGELRHLERVPAPAGAGHAHQQHERRAGALPVALVVELDPAGDGERHAASIARRPGDP